VFANIARSDGIFRLAIRNILFAVMGPGSVVGWIPAYILRNGHDAQFGAWTVYNYLGLAPIAAGAVVLMRCIWDFATAGRGTLSPVDPPKQLVVRGLYRYVRNPMYVAVMTILLGETLLFWSFEMLIYTGIFFTIVNIFVLFYEERVLGRQFGESYANYCRRVNRWLPRMPRSL
jgi:protein-S-isoprenylcysteine O-methyltransferase Ste14